jgi:putative phosphoesterase
LALTLGVVADTHIPDRMRRLPPGLPRVFEGVAAILHAGDISTPAVLDELAQIAPVHAVAGNADFARVRLPSDRVLEFEGVRIGLTHGHGGWLRYLWEKAVYEVNGYRSRRYAALAVSRFSGVQAVVYGHTHLPLNMVLDGVLAFNPGSLGPDYFAPYGAAVGLLTIADGQVRGKIVPVE